MSLKELCIRLDETTVEYFETLDKIIQSQNELNRLMSDGFILMAKARYNMGTNTVSKLQFPEDNMVASCTVKVSESSTVPAVSTFQIGHEEILAENSNGVQPSSGDGLRQRNITKEGAGTSTENEDSLEKKPSNMPAVQDLAISGDSSKKDSSKCLKDPLKWFGLLVPRSLHESQDRFKRSVVIACELATLKSNLEGLRCNFRKLLKEKEEIINSV